MFLPVEFGVFGQFALDSGLRLWVLVVALLVCVLCWFGVSCFGVLSSAGFLTSLGLMVV